MMKKAISYITVVFSLFALWLAFPENGLANSYSPYDVKMSDVNKRTKGDRSATFESGKKLVYDVYMQRDGKEGWSIKRRDFGKGSRQYLTFTGWSAVIGHRHHTENNQDTYIWLKNIRTGEDKFYKAEQLNFNASKDMEFNRQSQTGDIWNPCANSARNQNNATCNMYYEHVGFRAHVPLDELFKDGENNSDWQLRIVKRVGSTVLYDELRLPFEFENLSWGNGEISLSSGINAQQLRMIGNGVIRRIEPRGTTNSGNYFDYNRFYQRVNQDQKSTVVWYGVSSPHDSGRTRWAASSYWAFGGTIATLSYQVTKKVCPDGSIVNINQRCTVDVTITHKDYATGKILMQTKVKSTVGNSYSYAPEKAGFFKDSNGNPFVASPEGQKYEGTTPNNNMNFTFTYKVSLPNPSSIEELDGATEGKAQGEVSWRLQKIKENNPSETLLVNSATVAGLHFDVQNVENRIYSANVFNNVEDEPFSTKLQPLDVKKRDVLFSFSYEYTNHFRRNYTCTDQQGQHCFEWIYKDSTPVWDKEYKKSFQWEETFNLDYPYNETYNLEFGTDHRFLIGQTVEVGSKGEKESYYESLKLNDQRMITLLTQSWLPIFDKPIEYKSDFGEPFPYNIDEDFMFLYPVDLDESIQKKYQNKTAYAYTEYAIPLELIEIQEGEANQYKAYFGAKDDFFILDKTGFQFSVPRKSSKEDIKKQAKLEYESITKSKFSNENITTFDGQRYYLPVDPKSFLNRERQYKNHYVLGKLTLNDLTLDFGKEFAFQKYLLGSVYDDVYVNEQPESTLNVSYTHAVEIKDSQKNLILELVQDQPQLLHSFRTSDGDLYERLSNIISLE